MKSASFLNELFLFLIIFSGPSFLSATTPELQEELDKLQEQFEIPAVVVIVVNNKDIVFKYYSGFADIDSRLPVSEETVFRIGSITKMFTAISVLMLQNDGLLSLDTPIRKIEPDIPVSNRWSESRPIRLVHLLEHTAGLSDLSHEEFSFNEPLSISRALRWKARERKTRWPPGQHYSYTNVGAGLLEHIIEKSSGMSYAEYIERRIFKPLGMHSATIFPPEPASTVFATGYDSDARTPIPYWHMLYKAFGAINLKPAEIAAFIQFLLNYGQHNDTQLLSREAITAMETPGTTLAAKSGLRYGYSLGNYTSQRAGLLFHGHGGDADGYLSRLAYNRKTNLGYFAVINTFRPRAIEAIRKVIEESIAGTKPLNKKASRHITSVQEYQAYIGEYQAITRRFEKKEPTIENLYLLLKNGKLLLKYGKFEKYLIPVSSTHFRFEDEYLASSAFVRDSSGRQIYQGGLGNFVLVK